MIREHSVDTLKTNKPDNFYNLRRNAECLQNSKCCEYIKSNFKNYKWIESSEKASAVTLQQLVLSAEDGKITDGKAAK